MKYNNVKENNIKCLKVIDKINNNDKKNNDTNNNNNNRA